MPSFKDPVIQQTFLQYKKGGGTKGPETWYQENWKGGRYPQTQALHELARGGYSGSGDDLAGFGEGMNFAPIVAGGYGVGGGAGSLYDKPEFWSILEKQKNLQTGLLGQQEGFAQQGYGLAEQEAKVRRDNMNRLLGIRKERTGFEVDEAQKALANEAAARGSFMSQARILGQQMAAKAGALTMKEAYEQAAGDVRLLNEGLKQAHLSMTEELARLRTQRELAELEYQQALLNKP